MKKTQCFLATLMLTALVVFATGCSKLNDDNEEELFDFCSATCSVDLENINGDGLSLMCFFRTFALDSTSSQVEVPVSKSPQLIMVTDESAKVRMLYRGPIVAGQNVEINSHTTALALVGGSPFVSMMEDTLYDATIEAINALPSFASFESLVENRIAEGKDIFDIDDAQMIQGLQSVLDEFINLGDSVDMQRGMSKGSLAPPDWIDCSPLRFEWGSEDYAYFSLQNYLLTPSYYGTITTSDGREEQLMIPTNGSYSLILDGLGLIFREDSRYGDKKFVALSLDADNTIELTNWNDGRAKTEFVLYVASDVLSAAGCKLPTKTLQRIVPSATSIIASAMTGVNSHNYLIIAVNVTKEIGMLAIDVALDFLERGMEYAVDKQLVSNISNKIIPFYSLLNGGVNLATRASCFFIYSHDISFCINEYYDDSSLQRRIKQCGCDCNFTSGDWVDLGLPSGLLWATRNVGASSPTDYGNYFAWGETSPKSVYDVSTYRYYSGETGFTKYTRSDGLTTLQPGDDAATANYGGRTPTIEELRELFDNTTSQWVTINGVDGRCFTGPNGNSLFLPAAGCREDDELPRVGTKGYYWSSSLCVEDGWYSGWYGRFMSDYLRDGFLARYRGFPVRAVRQN